jgi:enoyl-CoA hydratase/carnithine racemase
MTDVLVERIGRSSLITLNRPEARNALTRGVLGAVRSALGTATSDPDIRCVVLTGAGGHFCSGADLRKNLMDDPDMMDHLEEYMDEYHATIRALVRCPKPCIAMMDGAAVGFGADLALACDLRVASTQAYLQERFVKIGLMPDGGGTFWLPRLIGTARAMQWILLAEKIEAPTLLELGLVMRVVQSSALRETTLSIALELERGAPLALAAVKQAVYASWGDLEGALRREREAQLVLLRTNDLMEGIMAWSQKREPKFSGS